MFRYFVYFLNLFGGGRYSIASGSGFHADCRPGYANPSDMSQFSKQFDFWSIFLENIWDFLENICDFLENICDFLEKCWDM